MNETPHERGLSFVERKVPLLLGLLLLAALVEGLLFVSFGPLAADGGTYLYAGKLVYEGKLPYVDFPYLQMPLLPYVYGIGQAITGGDVLVGRLTSLVLAMLAFASTAVVAWRGYGTIAALVCLALIVLTPKSVFLLILAMPYVLPAFWLALSYVFLTSSLNRNLRYGLAGLVVGLATASRLSAIWILPGLLLYISLLEEKKRVQYLALTSVLAVGTWGVLLLPFAWGHVDASYYQVWGFHAAREGFLSQQELLWKLEYIVGALGHSAVFIGVILGGAAYWLTQRPLIPRPATMPRALALSLSLGLSIGLFFLVHLTLAHPWNTHFSVAFPLLAILASGIVVGAYRRAQEQGVSPRMMASVTTALVALVALQAQWLGAAVLDPRVGQRELQTIREVAAFVSENVEPDEFIFTRYPHVAVESHRRDLPGMAVGPAAPFPDQAAAYHLPTS